MQLKGAVLYLLLVFVPYAAFCQESNPTSAPTEPVPSAPNFSNDQIRELIRQVAEKDLENDKNQRNYTYIEREEEHKLDGKGKVKSTETRTYEIMELYGGQVQRLIAKNDKPLSEKDAAKEEEKVQKIIDKRKNETGDEHKKRQEKEERNLEEGRQFVREIAVLTTSAWWERNNSAGATPGSLMLIRGRDISPTTRTASIFPNSAFAPGSTRPKRNGQSSISSVLTRFRGGCLSPVSTKARAS